MEGFGKRDIAHTCLSHDTSHGIFYVGSDIFPGVGVPIHCYIIVAAFFPSDTDP